MMLKLASVLLTILLIVSCLNQKFANLASILPNQPDHILHLSNSNNGRPNATHKPGEGGDRNQAPTLSLIDLPPQATPANQQQQQQQATTESPFAATSRTQVPSLAATTFDSNSDPDESGQISPAPDRANATTQASDDTNSQPDEKDRKPKLPPSQPLPAPSPPTKATGNETTLQSPPSVGYKGPQDQRTGPFELRILFYSVFIVYVSFVKLFYHNVQLIKHNLTEPGILMVFGIIWQLVSRQISTDYDTLPRFNSRIFFYLFLPSTVLESASLLSNKWLFFNLLPILTHSTVGTVLYASAMGFSIYSLARSHIFTLNWMGVSLASSGPPSGSNTILATISGQDIQAYRQLTPLDGMGNQSGAARMAEVMEPRQLDIQTSSHYEFNNLTLADCLIFGTILSSIDSTPMLTVFKQYQVNEKLYYLVLGENLMNNAVVIMIFKLLMDFFETTRLTVVKIYIAILQFFANLIGAIFIGLAMAVFALVSVRLTKRFQVANNVLSSYQNQCQAMVETLLVLKLAYLTFTLSNLAGTSSIVALATFGILNDQYIKQNLNLRSQLAFRQVTLAMKTMGFSLVYPLLGMLLVDTALSNPHHSHHHHHHHHNQQQQQQQQQQQAAATSFNHKLKIESANLAVMEARQEPVERWPHFQSLDGAGSPPPPPPVALLLSGQPSRAEDQNFPLKTSASVATKKLTSLANQANLHWNFKFLSIVVVLTIVYRFLIVIALGLLGNVLTCGQIKIKVKEQILMAYGGFKGPLSIALVHSLIEHNDHEDRMTTTKHLFKYTILFNIFISAVLAGTFIRPLVARIQSTLIGHSSTNLDETNNVESTMVFERINYKLTENVAHGLNSILGHTRSPYDKFLEFNETHIKRWLVRKGSTNTNWLSIFYDNLILDETLNANCFYVATEDPTTMRTFRNQQRQMQIRQQQQQQLAPRRHRSSISFLDPISEHKTLAKVGPQVSSDRSIKSSIGKLLAENRGSTYLSAIAAAYSSKSRSRQQQQPQQQSQQQQVRPPALIKADRGSQVAPIEKPITPMSGRQDEEVLREFVMLNLKLEDAKRRRQAQKRPAGRPLRLVALSTSEADDTSNEPNSRTRDTHVNMIDSSASGDELKFQANTIDKQAVLNGLETRLEAASNRASRPDLLDKSAHANERLSTTGQTFILKPRRLGEAQQRQQSPHPTPRTKHLKARRAPLR